MATHTWSPDHPHANDKQWTETNFSYTKVWSWTHCAFCKVKTAAAAGAGRPICDACFKKQCPYGSLASGCSKPQAAGIPSEEGVVRPRFLDSRLRA